MFEVKAGVPCNKDVQHQSHEHALHVLARYLAHYREKARLQTALVEPTV
jgi:hypothetical protein